MDEVSVAAVGAGDLGGTAENAAHIEAMVQKADAGLDPNKSTPAPQSGDTKGADKLLAGKYKSEEELQKGFIEAAIKQHGSLEAAYKAAEKGLGKTPEEKTKAADTKPAAKTSADPDQIPIGDAEQVTLDDLATEYVNTGKLSEASVKILTDNGVPQEFITQYLEGVKATIELTQMKVHAHAGGPEAYKELIQWGAKNYPRDDSIAFNKAIESGDFTQIKQAIDALKSRFVAANGQETGRLRPNGGSNQTGADVFGSWDEVKSAMKDPRYEKDAAYRNQVEQKTMRSQL
jgi:hypothetical protein